MSGALTYVPKPRGARARKNEQPAAVAQPVRAEVKPQAGKTKSPARAAYAKAAKTDLERRNEMIIEYLPLVKFIASRIASRLPNHIEVADLVNSGIIGL